MDSEAEQASEDYAVLGKRKRDAESQELKGNSTRAVAVVEGEDKEDEEVHPPLAVSGHKRPRFPSPELADRHTVEEQRLTQLTSTLDKLPIEVLQHICLFLDPFNLGRLIRVNRAFRSLLDAREPHPLSSRRCKILPLLSQNAIWSLSRRRFSVAAPEPLGGLSEHAMIQLVLGPRCQYCGRLPSKRAMTMTKSQWNAGPGPEGVRAVLPFRIRSCAECLRPRLIKEQDLMLSPSSALRPGLPFACFTPSLHYITTVSLQNSSLPAGLQLTKYYFRPQIEDLEKQMEQIKTFAPAAYTQWYRGLEPVLADLMSDVTRVEYREWKDHAADPHEIPHLDTSSHSSYSGRSGRNPSSYTVSNFTSTNSSGWQYRNSYRVDPAQRYSSVPSPSVATPKPLQDSGTRFMMKSDQPLSTVVPDISSSSSSKNVERTIQDVRRIQTQRRLDIEKRCMQLDPPLLETDLINLKAFNAAIQIVQPLDETAWERLKLRLLAEYRAFQDDNQAEGDSTSSHFLSRETVINDLPEATSQSHSDLLEQAQRNTRDKVIDIAQNFIKRSFMNGTNVTADTAPIFAAEVLEHVSQAFYETQQQQDAELALQGQAPPGNSQSGMRTRHLQLRHMKHVVDKCILPYTELVQKDLFSCSGCEPSEKLFPFVGLIQHYAAKHTDTFSRGSRIVHWDSQWPDVPPYRLPPTLSISASGDRTQHLQSPPIPQHTYSRGSNSPYGLGYPPAPVSQPDRSNHSSPPSDRVNQYSGQVSDRYFTYGATKSPQLPSHTQDGNSLDKPMDASPRAVYERQGMLKAVNPSASASQTVEVVAGEHMQSFSSLKSSEEQFTSVLKPELSSYRAHGSTPDTTHETRSSQDIHRDARATKSRPSSIRSFRGHVTRSPISSGLERTSSKQVDDFFKTFDMDEDLTEAGAEGNISPGHFQQTPPYEDQILSRSHLSRTNLVPDAYAPYQAFRESGLREVASQHRFAPQQSVTSHDVITRPFADRGIRNPAQYDYRDPRQIRQAHPPQQYERVDRLTGERSITQLYPTHEDRDTRYTATPVRYARQTPPEFQTSPATHVRSEHYYMPHNAAPPELSPPATLPHYRHGSHNSNHYVVVEQRRVPVTDDRSFDREYAKHPVYGEPQYYASRSPDVERYQPDDYRWQQRR